MICTTLDELLKQSMKEKKDTEQIRGLVDEFLQSNFNGTPEDKDTLEIIILGYIRSIYLFDGKGLLI